VKRRIRVSCFPGSAEALVRCGGKIKYILIAYFLGNICVKNCRNRTVYVKIIASCKGGTFFETQCILTRIANDILIYTTMHAVGGTTTCLWGSSSSFRLADPDPHLIFFKVLRVYIILYKPKL